MDWVDIYQSESLFIYKINDLKIACDYFPDVCKNFSEILKKCLAQ